MEVFILGVFEEVWSRMDELHFQRSTLVYLRSAWNLEIVTFGCLDHITTFVHLIRCYYFNHALK
jgi:hypothetical protein